MKYEKRIYPKIQRKSYFIIYSMLIQNETNLHLRVHQHYLILQMELQIHPQSYFKEKFEELRREIKLFPNHFHQTGINFTDTAFNPSSFVCF